MKKLKVAVLANIKKNAPKWEDMPEDQWDDLDSEKTVLALVEAIRGGGYNAEFLEGDETLMITLPKYRPDICFNICEGHFGDSREAQVPAILEMLRIPYTGSRVLALAMALDKPMTKRILWWHELPTPAFQEFDRADEALNDDLVYPLFVKPSREGTSMGVSAKSIVKTDEELREQVRFIIEKYKQPALVEQYIEGREVTVGMVGNLIGPVARRLPSSLNAPRVQSGLHFLPPMEVDLKPYLLTDAVYSNRLKVALADKIEYLCPAPWMRIWWMNSTGWRRLSSALWMQRMSRAWTSAWMSGITGSPISLRSTRCLVWPRSFPTWSSKPKPKASPIPNWCT